MASITDLLEDISTNTAGNGGSLTDLSGTITTGGTSQSLVAANVTRKYLLLQNPSNNVNSESLWVRLDGSAAVVGSPSVEIPVGGSLIFEGNFIPTGAVTIIAATTGTQFTAKEG